MVERAQHFLLRRQRVKTMQVIDVDVIGTQPPQAAFASLDQVMARRSQIVRPRSHAERRLRRDENLVPSPGDRLAENGFGESV